jgi:hypothetical protein
VYTNSPPGNYTTADFAQLLAVSTGYNASKVFRILEAQSTITPSDLPRISWSDRSPL